jgi:hypothetical protein
LRRRKAGCLTNADCTAKAVQIAKTELDIYDGWTCHSSRHSCARPATKCGRATGQAPRTRDAGRSSPRAARPYVRIRRRRHAESHGRSYAPARLPVSLMIHRLPFQTMVRTGSISKPVAQRIHRSIQRSQCGRKRHHTRRGSNPTQSSIAGIYIGIFSLSCDSIGILPNVGLANASTLDRRNFHSRRNKIWNSTAQASEVTPPAREDLISPRVLGLSTNQNKWEEAGLKSLTSGRARRVGQAVGYFLVLADRFYLTFTYFLNLCGPTSAA